ncbi:hypothetical protein D8674_040293 [Pyrus ussuriensis x Pyrus communis]|uniref:Uncharacterized protein n=1 Tax=Pyrus ussuriensis x Pyrus communis TaxID=2448454 RepID=A0A5N5HJF0_9ROSA|nr:hypothetical protein D8674_040293 [Pyrus ussuriensis x Pyrus communis]
MSNLIRSRKAVTTAPRSSHPTHLLAAIAPAQMNHLLVGPGVSQAPASSASSVALLVSNRRGHCRPRTLDTPSTSNTDLSGSHQDKMRTQVRSQLSKAKANKSNRDKKTLLHHSSSRLFSYRMKVRWQRSMSLATFMFNPGMSWPSPFIIQ